MCSDAKVSLRPKISSKQYAHWHEDIKRLLHGFICCWACMWDDSVMVYGMWDHVCRIVCLWWTLGKENILRMCSPFAAQTIGSIHLTKKAASVKLLIFFDQKNWLAKYYLYWFLRELFIALYYCDSLLKILCPHFLH